MYCVHFFRHLFSVVLLSPSCLLFVIVRKESTLLSKSHDCRYSLGTARLLGLEIGKQEKRNVYVSMYVESGSLPIDADAAALVLIIWEER